MSLVADAGFVVAGLVDGGTDGLWAEELLAGTDLAAPHLMPVEAANILRRAATLAGEISQDVAALAHGDLLGLRVTLFAYYAPCIAQRVWELRGNVTNVVPTTPGTLRWRFTIRDVPDAACVELASRAATSGRSLQEYLRMQLIELASRPDPEALVARIQRLWTANSPPSITACPERRAADARS